MPRFSKVRGFMGVMGTACLVATLAGAAAWGEAGGAPPARAKAVIELWLAGGPPHTDTFDPKPDAGYDYTGPLKSVIPTNVSGIQIGELLPLLAQQADKYSLIRSMTVGTDSHETAAYMMQTGHPVGDGLVWPCVGAVVGMFKGYDHGYQNPIPPYVVLTQSLGRFSPAGFLGLKYEPFVTGGDPNAERFAVEGIVAAKITDQRQRDRRDLLRALDLLGRAMPNNPRLAEMDNAESKAYELILGDAGKIFDLSQEPAEMRDKYGRNSLGQSCLVARRLVELGVPYVTINNGGWDTHKQHFEAMRRKLPELDQALAALLQDLSDRKLLDTTIVWCRGEFGRTPKVYWEQPWNGGRGHYGRCFSVLVAGGGFQGGRVVGASDARGENVVERPVKVQDLIGSIYELLGIDPNSPLPNPKGLEVQVAPPMETGPGKGRLSEIM
ncbi:MAG: DUF1501 domain-containing protein [candidate division WS1 bacterium]|nr:DUF1501 domain-containing protein [candidate division WS1 bacterium]